MAIQNIDYANCSGCKICFDVCPLDVIRFDDKEKRPYIAYPEDCISCTACESYCPHHCILVMPDKERRVPAPY